MRQAHALAASVRIEVDFWTRSRLAHFLDTDAQGQWLRKIYLGNGGVDPGKETIAYCRIGERSSHTWVVLKYLLGLDNVKNYDGSWTEYGSLVGVPIELGDGN